MMLQLAAHGRFGADPREITTKSGTAMAVGSVAVTLSDRQGEELTEWLGVIGFGKQAELLLRHKKGDLASVAGRAQRNIYTTTAGEQRNELQIIVDTIVSARTARPGGGRKREPSPEADPFEGAI